jgi:hypothetical protein
MSNEIQSNFEIKEFLKILRNPSLNRNTIMASPAIIHIFSNPFDYYTGSTKIFLYPFKNYSQDSLYVGTELIINNVSWKTIDDEIINNNVSLSHNSLPVKKIIEATETNLERNPFEIFVDTTNIITDYTNSIIVDFTYNGIDSNREIPVNI